MRRFGRALALSFTLMGSAATAAVAQVEISSRAVQMRLTGRAQTQFSTSSVSGVPSSDFEMRRVRVTVEMTIDDLITGKIQPDYGRGGLTLKDAYLRFNFDDAFRLSFGQFKRPFDLFEVSSSADLLVIERAGSIRGVEACAGPGGTCTLSRLTEKLQYADRDIGLLADGRLHERVAYRVSVTNGTGANNPDENDTKSYAGRVTVNATPDLRISGNIGVHDYVNAATGDEYAVAFGGDVEVGRFNDGLHVQAGVIAGDNWRNLDTGNEPTSFVTAQGIVSYRVPLRADGKLKAVEPLARVSWADPDTDATNAGGVLVTPGVALRFTGKNMLVANVDVWSPQTGDTEWSFRLQSFLHF